MSKPKKHIRGESKLANALNKPIGGSLGKKRSSVFVSVFGVIASLGLWWFASSKLGFKAGTGLTLFTVAFVIFYYFEHKHIHTNRTAKFIKEDD